MQYYEQPVSPKFMAEDDGTNAPRSHQRTIAQLIAGLYPLFRAGAIALEALPRTMVGEYNSPTPDVILYDNTNEVTPVIIEICHLKGEKNDLRKVIRLMEEDDYGILEGFVYNYKTEKWLRYWKGDGGQAIESSFSEVLQLDLNSFLL